MLRPGAAGSLIRARPARSFDHRRRTDHAGVQPRRARRRSLFDGRRGRGGVPRGRRGPRAGRGAEPVRDRGPCRDQSPLRGLRRRHGLQDGRRALRLVVRLRGPAAGQLSRHARRRRRTVVAAGLRCNLALSRGPAIRDRGQTRSPRRTRLVARRRGLLRLGAAAASDRGRVGVRRTRWVGPEALSVGR